MHHSPHFFKQEQNKEKVLCNKTVLSLTLIKNNNTLSLKNYFEFVFIDFIDYI